MKYNSHNLFSTLEPVKLIGEGEYKIDAWKEIHVTESYLGLDKDVMKCQNEESIQSCQTEDYVERLLKVCGCLPYELALAKKVK